MIAPPDRDLLTAAAGGDRGAFAAIVDRHQAAVWRLARALTHSPVEAEDAMQEAFVAAWKGAQSWDGRGSVRSWLLTLTRHATFRHLRRRAGEPPRFEPLDTLARSAGWGEQVDPESLAAALERRVILQRALARLSPADREILILRELEELEGAAVAELLDVSLPAMKSRLHRARLRLVAAVREEVADA